MPDENTFYCPRCGNRISAMPCQAIGCPRCGRPVRSRLVSGFQPASAMSVAVPLGQPPGPPRRGGTPGIVVALLLYFFFPVGLYLLWADPIWTAGQKWKYTMIWLTLVGALFLAALLASISRQ